MKRRHKRRLHQQRILVIDGHNVCHQDDHLQRLMQRDPESARRALEQRIGERAQCHIFYDGGPGGEERRQHHGSLAIHYSGNRSADDCILEWLSYQDCDLVSVVTDDRGLQLRVRGSGAQTVRVSDFLNSLHQTEPDKPGIDEVPPSQDEIDFWKNEFGV